MLPADETKIFLYLLQDIPVTGQPECYECGEKRHMGRVIPLRVEFLDGNKKNRSRANVALMCLNCYAVSPNRSKYWNRRNPEYVYDYIEATKDM